MSNKEINERKQLFKQLFDSDDANDFLNSDVFELSQQIMILEHKLQLDQKQAARIVSMSLEDFLDFEMGISTNQKKYRSIIHALELKLNPIPTKNTYSVDLNSNNLRTDKTATLRIGTLLPHDEKSSKIYSQSIKSKNIDFSNNYGQPTSVGGTT